MMKDRSSVAGRRSLARTSSVPQSASSPARREQWLPTTNDRRLTTIFMRIAYLDCFSGISGDRFLGALINAGVSPKLLEDTVKALNIGARLEISTVVRAGISATKVDVYANGEKDLPREVFWEQQKNDHAHEHSHSHDHSREHRHGHGRALTEIRKIIEEAVLSSTAKAT